LYYILTKTNAVFAWKLIKILLLLWIMEVRRTKMSNTIISLYYSGNYKQGCKLSPECIPKDFIPYVILPAIYVQILNTDYKTWNIDK
jgi:hypothetical protein